MTMESEGTTFSELQQMIDNKRVTISQEHEDDGKFVRQNYQPNKSAQSTTQRRCRMPAGFDEDEVREQIEAIKNRRNVFRDEKTSNKYLR